MKRNRMQFLSFIIERTATGYWLLDWDYEGEYTVAGPFQSAHRAMDEAVRRERGD